jgi:lipase chaperone LimK
MTTRTSIIWIGTAALVAAVFFTIVFLQREEDAPPKAVAEANLFPFVRSLEGTRPDGDIKVAAGDVLVIDAELRRLFDYYLAAVGEKSLEAIRAEIERELERRLQPGAAGEAKRLLARYLDYKRELVEVEKNPQLAGGAIAAVRGRFTTMRQVRSRFFNDSESEGLFGFEDAYDMDAVARLEISQNTALTDKQKQEKLAALDAALPPALREAREAPQQIIKLEEAAQKMRTQGASEDEVYRMRAAALSPEAAARLAEADQEDATWKNRVASYLAERNTVIGRSANLPEPDRQATIQQLRDMRFNIDEQKRLPAYE